MTLVDMYEELDDNHISVTQGDSGWYFYSSDNIDANGNVVAGDHKLYDTSELAAKAAFNHFGYQ